MTRECQSCGSGDYVIAVPARDMTGAEFARSLGLNIRTPEQKAAEWRAECERFADYIEAGKDGAVPPPYLWDARRIVEERALSRKVEAELRFTIEHLEPKRRSA